MEIQEVEKKLRQLNTHYSGVLEERSAMVNEQAELMERKTKLELTISDLSEDLKKERSGKVGEGTTFGWKPMYGN